MDFHTLSRELLSKFRRRSRAMNRICAWCGKSLDEKAFAEDLQITHGLCEPCRKAVFVSSRAGESVSVIGEAGAAAGAESKSSE